MKKIADDKQIFRKSLLTGFIIIVLGLIINMITSMNTNSGFNFTGALVSGLGLLIIIFALLYAVVKVIVSTLSSSKKKK